MHRYNGRRLAMVSLVCILALAGCATAAGALESKLAGKPMAQRLAILEGECRAVADLDRGSVEEKEARAAALRQRCVELGAALARIEGGHRDIGATADFQRSLEACIDESKRDGAMVIHRWSSGRHTYYLHARAVCDAYDKIFRSITGAGST